ncbi:MAG: 50S ribosomal protein L11 methyltransferase [Monoglobales bacterium]
MNWTEITVKIANQAVEMASGVFYATGVSGVSITDASLLEESERLTSSWDVLDDDVRQQYETEFATLKAYYPPKTNINETIKTIEDGIKSLEGLTDISGFEISAKEVHEQDWENEWKKYYKPVPVGKRIIIKPQWEEIFDESRDVVIELDPGMAFGTGTHETTRMCLALLEEFVTPDSSMLDIGTGSGILSVGAAKLGCSKIVASDIDSVAVKVARENAELNKVADKIDIRCCDLTTGVTGKFSIVVANIIADAVIMLSESAANFLTDDGVYITSGIIEHRLEDVKDALIKYGFKIDRIVTEGEWAAIVCTK